MKRCPWRIILASIAVSLLVVGLAPLVYLYCWGAMHKLEALAIPLPLKRGEYSSAFFKTDLDGEYQIEIDPVPWNQTPLDLGWRIVDASGAVLQSGVYREQPIGGNNVILGHYRPQPGASQRVLLDLLQDRRAPDSELKVHIGLPERGLGQAYASAAVTLWAAIVTGLGAMMLLVLFLLRELRIRVSAPVPLHQS